MIRSVENRVWAFDLEWAPDPLAGRLLYGLDDDVDDRAVLDHMWQAGGATDDDPTPFLKLVQCRVVSIAAVERRELDDGRIALNLMSLPRDPADPEQTDEARIIGAFLDAVGQHRPQLVGFNSVASDLKILIQRGLVLGIRAAGFSRRPEKPWQGVDYFARGSDYNLDLRELVGGFGRGVPSLHELAVQSGIPGKLDVDGNQVAQLWLDGQLAEIVAYNECDALTTYLVWLRAAHFAGRFTDSGYAAEQERVRALIEAEIADSRSHLRTFLDAWDKLSAAVAHGRARGGS